MQLLCVVHYFKFIAGTPPQLDHQNQQGAQWEILAIFGSLQNPDFIQILGPKKCIFLYFGAILVNFQILASNVSHIFKLSRRKRRKKLFFELQNW